MKKLALVVLTLTLLVGGAAAASAQQDDYPPATANVTLAGGNFVPGGAGNLAFFGGQAGASYNGTAFSTPIPLPATVAQANGAFNFSFSVPADFELGKIHQATVVGPGGGNFSYCVTTAGAVAAASACSGTGGGAGAIPRTGSDYIDDGLRGAAVAIGLGAMLLLWRRRHAGPATTPA